MSGIFQNSGRKTQLANIVEDTISPPDTLAKCDAGLASCETETELFAFLAYKIMTLCSDYVVVVTKGEQTLSNKPISHEGLRSCSHEEAVSRIFTYTPVNR